MDIFDYAIKMELDGKAYYEKLAAETSVPGLKTVFIHLANDEQKHCDTIKELQKGTAAAMADSHVWEETENVFEQLKNNCELAEELTQTLDGYQHARKIEGDSIVFYESMARKESDPEIVKSILKIAAEERKHFNIMDNLCDFTLAPQYFLAWREFSNLKGL